MEYDVKYTCRACLVRTDSGTSIFEMASVGTKFVDMLANCVNIEPNTTDLEYYPNKLCPSCVETLPIVWKFVEICKASEKVLQKYFNDVGEIDNQLSYVEGQITYSIKEEIKEEGDLSDALSVKSELFCSVNELDEVYNKRTNQKKYNKKNAARKRKIDKKKNADVKVYCPICEDVFDTELKWRKHMKIVHPGRTDEIVYTCKVCKKQFKRKTDLVVHRRIHSGEKPFECPVCFRSFSQSGTLMEHSRVHTGETPFTCKICNKVFSSRSSFWRHRLVHTKEKLYACEVCGKTFAHSETLKQHRSVHSEERPHSCNICDKALKSKYALQQHLLIHSGKHFICEHCGKKFSVKHNVEQHIKKMHSNNAGECCVCSKVTSNLSEHMLLHNGLKPYKCNICNREFRQKNSLSFHLTMHRNAEKYKCKVEGCDKAFPKENMLTFHINKIHSNETPHVCSKCSKGFYRSSDLSRHFNIVHLDCM